MEGKREPERESVETGTGALCPEAQADGVPCPDVGRDCEICKRAVDADKSRQDKE